MSEGFLGSLLPSNDIGYVDDGNGPAVPEDNEKEENPGEEEEKTSPKQIVDDVAKDESKEVTAEDRYGELYDRVMDSVKEAEYTTEPMDEKEFVETSLKFMELIKEMEEFNKGIEEVKIGNFETVYSSPGKKKHSNVKEAAAETVTEELLGRQPFRSAIIRMNDLCTSIGDIYYVFQHAVGKGKEEVQPYVRLFDLKSARFARDNLAALYQVTIRKLRILFVIVRI